MIWTETNNIITLLRLRLNTSGERTGQGAVSHRDRDVMPVANTKATEVVSMRRLGDKASVAWQPLR